MTNPLAIARRFLSQIEGAAFAGNVTTLRNRERMARTAAISMRNKGKQDAAFALFAVSLAARALVAAADFPTDAAHENAARKVATARRLAG